VILPLSAALLNVSVRRIIAQEQTQLVETWQSQCSSYPPVCVNEPLFLKSDRFGISSPKLLAEAL